MSEETRTPRLRPAPLRFEPPAPERPIEHFFDLDSIEDPAALLSRSTELADAFRAASRRASDFQAVAAAQLADPRRFDRLSTTQIAERLDCSPQYADKVIEYGRSLLRGGHE